MNRIEKKTGEGLSHGAALRGWLSGRVLSTVSIASLVFTAANARAACGNFSGIGSRSAVTLPMMAQAEEESGASVSSQSIVGLWHVTYKAGGKLFNETLDQWHSDGTEFENAFLPVAGGNICFGVWKSVGARTVRLHHVGWTYDPAAGGTANGTFTLDETNVVASTGNGYTGTFTFRTYSLQGVQGAEVKGTISATRITVE